VNELLLSSIKWPAGGGIRHTEIQTAEPFVQYPSSSDVEVATGTLKRYKSLGPDRNPPELIQAGRGGGIRF
jgi:hypothetical protein